MVPRAECSGDVRGYTSIYIGLAPLGQSEWRFAIGACAGDRIPRDHQGQGGEGADVRPDRRIARGLLRIRRRHAPRPRRQAAFVQQAPNSSRQKATRRRCSRTRDFRGGHPARDHSGLRARSAGLTRNAERGEGRLLGGDSTRSQPGSAGSGTRTSDSYPASTWSSA